MIKTDLKITTNHVLVLGVVTVAGVALYRAANAAKGVVTEGLNPLSDKNYAYRAYEGQSTEASIRSVDLLFANLTLLNPIASDEKKQDARNLKRIFYGEYGGGR